MVGEVSLAAEAFGVHPGMRLGEALARCPRLTLIPPDPAGVADAWERLLVRLESIGAAMPGVGYLVGGLIASGTSPRTTFLVAGIGVLTIVTLAVPIMGRKWPESREKADGKTVDAGAEIMVELIPVGEIPPVRAQSKSEVAS